MADFYTTVGGIRLGRADTARAVEQIQALPRAYRDGLVMMLAAMSDAQRLRSRAYTTLTRSQISYVESVALRALFNPSDVAASDALLARSLVDQIDMVSMARAATLVQQAAAVAMPRFTKEGAPRHVVSLPYGAVTIGTAGDDRYESDTQLLIDPGGDDTYLNNAGGLLSSQAIDTSGGCVAGGGATGKAPPNLNCTPLPPTVCSYDVLNNASGRNDLPVVSVPNHDVPGTGSSHEGTCGNAERQAALISDTQNIANDHDSRGVAVLLDEAGNDTYSTPWSYTDSLFGLIAFCYPNDHSRENTNRDIFQGGSLAGISLLWDDGPGNNTFRGRLNVQGSGHVGGVGMLLSTGGGDDFYWADRLAQGNGIAGGIGVLADTGGTNTYLLENPVVYRNEFRPAGRECSQEGRAGQAQGGFGGVGVLWNEGPATYRAVTHVTSPTAPYAPVLDGSGAPKLVAGTDAQGSGESAPIPGTPGGLVAGIGLLVDTGTGGPATVCDGGGKIDGASYVTRSPGAIDVSCGRFNVKPEISREDLGAALDHLAGGALGIRVTRP